MNNIRNFLTGVTMEEAQCHDGQGTIRNLNLFKSDDFAAKIDFINYAILPPGTSIGNHQHGDDEELYIVLEGEGEIFIDGECVPVKVGDVAVNRPFGTHGLTNCSAYDLKILVIEVRK